MKQTTKLISSIISIFYLWMILKSGSYLISHLNNGLDFLSIILIFIGTVGVWGSIKQKPWVSLLTVFSSGFLTFLWATQLHSNTVIQGSNFGFAASISAIVLISSLFNLHSQYKQFTLKEISSNTLMAVIFEGLLYLIVYYLSSIWYLAFHRNNLFYPILSSLLRPTWLLLFITISFQFIFRFIRDKGRRQDLCLRYNTALELFFRSSILMLIIFLFGLL